MYAFIVGTVAGLARLAADLVMKNDGSVVADLKQRGTPAASVIGSIVAADSAGVIEVTA